MRSKKRNGVRQGALLCVILLMGACSSSDDSATESSTGSDVSDPDISEEQGSELEEYLRSDERAQRLDAAVNAFADEVLALDASGAREFEDPYNVVVSQDATEGWRTLDTHGNEDHPGYVVIVYYDENGNVVPEKGAISASIYTFGEPERSARISLARASNLYAGEPIAKGALPYSEVTNAPGFEADYKEHYSNHDRPPSTGGAPSDEEIFATTVEEARAIDDAAIAMLSQLSGRE